MSKVLIEKDNMTSLANTIKSKAGITDKVSLEELEEVANSLSNGSGGTSVQADWSQNDPEQPDYIKGRTHYEIPPDLNIQWDGDMTGRFALDISSLGYDPGTYFVKINDMVLTPDDLIGCTYTAIAGGLVAQTITDGDITVDSPIPGTYNVNNWIIVVYSQSTVNAVLGAPDGYVTNGTYFLLVSNEDRNLYVDSLVGASEIKKIDEKFLPELAEVAKSGSYYDLLDRPSELSGNFVRYDSTQSLSTTQKNTARNNIGAQTALSFDSTPRNGSSNPVTSGGVYTAIQDVYAEIQTVMGSYIEDIDTLIGGGA